MTVLSKKSQRHHSQSKTRLQTLIKLRFTYHNVYFSGEDYEITCFVVCVFSLFFPPVFFFFVSEIVCLWTVMFNDGSVNYILESRNELPFK